MWRDWLEASIEKPTRVKVWVGFKLPDLFRPVRGVLFD